MKNSGSKFLRAEIIKTGLVTKILVAFTQESGGGKSTLILTPSLTGSAQKYVPPSLE